MQKIVFGFLLMMSVCLASKAQNCVNANLEMAGVTGTYPTGNGPDTSAQVFTFSNNVNNPTDNIMSTYSPATTVKFTLSNQQFTNMTGLASPKTGMAFGRTFNAGSAKTSGQSGINSNPATNYTSNNYASGTGITGTTTVTATTNVGTWLMINDGNGVAGTNQRPYYGDLTITFNNPVDYPVLHFNDFGGITAGKQFVAEYEMSSGYSMTKLSGGASILVSGDTIKGTPQSLQSGSIRINGTGITSITFKVYLKSNSTTAWGTGTGGDAMVIGVSVPSTVPVKPSITKTTITNVCPASTVNLNNALPTAIVGQSYEWQSVATNPNASTKILNPATYSGASPVYLFAKDSLTGCYSLTGDTLAVKIVNCTYTISCTGTTVFREDFGSSSDNLPFGVSGAEHPYDSTFCINGFITNNTAGYIGTGVNFTNDVAGDGDTGTHFLAHFTGVGGTPCGNVVGEAAWKSIASINVVAGQVYEFSYYYRAQNNSGSATVIQQQIVPASGTITKLDSTYLPIQLGSWVKNTMRFTASVSGPITLRLNDMLGPVGGNDFALDNIALTSIPPSMTALNDTILSSCPSGTYNLSTLNPATEPGYTYEWHTVSSNPSAATLISNPTAATGSGPFYLYTTSPGGCYSIPDTVTAVQISCPPTFNCTGNTYLVQGLPANLLKYDLLTGQTSVVKSPLAGSTASLGVNSIGYNVKDGYLWGYQASTGTIVRIGADGTTDYYPNTGLPAVTTNAGDVSSDGILYLCGQNLTTIYRIDVNPASPKYLQLLLPNLTTTAYNYPDFAFNPIDGNLYALSATRQLIRINATTGAATAVGIVSGGTPAIVSDNFGAVFFDSLGNFYVSSNTSGNIFKIANTSTGGLTATFVSAGPASGSNDGARCNGTPLCVLPQNPVASSTSVYNQCPSTTYNLTALQPAAVTGVTYEWHTVSTNPLSSTLVSNPSAITTSGTYYLFAKSNQGSCYSNAGDTVVVNIFNPCTDCDADGIPNQIDLDDDNDGVADAIENCNAPNFANNVNANWALLNGTSVTTKAGNVSVSTTPVLGTTNNAGTYLSTGNCGGPTPDWGHVDINFSAPVTNAVFYIEAMEFGTEYATLEVMPPFTGTPTLSYTSFGDGATLTQLSPTSWRLNSGANCGISSGCNSRGYIQISGAYYNKIRYAGGSATGTTWCRNLRLNLTDASVQGACVADLDNDGIPNECDLDSDGDGCSDAVEAGNIPKVPASAWTSTTVYPSTSPSSTSSSLYNTYALAPSLSYCNLPDCDSDGIANLYDIDDDNDGILDVVEMNCEKISNGYFNGNVTLGWAYTGNVVVSSNLLNFNSGNTVPNGTATQVVPTVAGQNLTLTYTIAASAITNLGVKVDIIDSATNVVLATRSIIKNVAPAVSNEQVNFVATGAKTKIIFTDISTVTNSVDIYIDNVSMLYCDNDNDGIPNSCDVDSDNDGCPDAVEAGATSIKTQSTFAGPYGLNGLANSIENNDSLTANISNEPYFLIPNYGSYAANPNTIICADDCDNDGIPNEWDIDDDNDGVLDALETCDLLVENFGAGTPPAIPTTNILVTSAQASVVSAVPPHSGNAWFSGQLDHTPNDVNGDMLFVYNVSSPTVVYTKTISNLTIGRKYNFSAYIANPMQAGWMSPNITFIVRDASNAIIGQYNTGNLLNGSFNWQKYGFDVIATSATAKIEIVDNVTSAANNNLGQDDIAIDDISFGICDYDNDGIPNTCDTDDDNDGCPTAYEAGATSTKTQFTFAGPYGANGLAASLENNDTPTASTSYSNSYLNVAQDSTVKACDDCDNDGISNVIDTDDDNDGVSDIIECPSSSPYKIYTHNYTNAAFVTNLPIKITGSSVKNYSLDQSAVQNDLTYAGVGWKLMASDVYSDISKNIKIEMLPSPLTTGTYIIADAMLITNGIDTIMMNDNHTGFTKTGTWTAQAVAGSIAGTNWYAQAPFTQTATFTFSNIENPKTACDRDNDGILNQCDLDADGDGCADAVEAGNALANDAVYASTSIYPSLPPTNTTSSSYAIFALDNALSKCKVDTTCGAPSNIVLNGDMNGTLNTTSITNWTNVGTGTLWQAKAGTGTNIYAYNDHDAAGTDSLSQNIKICELPTNDLVVDFVYSLREGSNTSTFKVFWNGVPYYTDSTATGASFIHTISYQNGASGSIPSGTYSSSTTPIPWQVPGAGWGHLSLTIPVPQNAGQGLTGRLTFGIRAFSGTSDDVFIDSVVVKGANCINAGNDMTACNSSVVNLTGKSYYQGTTNWTSAPSNPGTSIIANANATSTTVSGFSAVGTYKYILSNGTCSDTVNVAVSICSTPDTNKVTPTCPTCPITSCVVADDLTPGGQTYSSCGTPNGYTAVGPDANGCITYTPNGPNTSPDTSCIVACKNGICDTTYIIINPPITPDTNKVTPACPTCPITSCVVADDLTPGGQTYTSCGTPNGYTAVGPDANGCITYTPNGPNTTPDTTCIVACKNGICDTTFIIINPPITPDTNKVTPACPTCPITSCVVADDLTPGGQTYSSCGTPNGYTAVGPDANGCITYTPNGPNTSPDTTCIVACKNGICDTTFIIINPPVTPDTNKVTPACPTCPITSCVVADDLTPGGQTYTSCGTPNGYTAVGPDANGCITYTPNGPNTSPDTTCIVACKNGICDTTFIIINPPITPDTNKVTPACPTCPITSCVVADDLTPGGQTYTSCGTPNGYTAVGPDVNGCITYTPSGLNTSPDTTCIVACKNGICDTTFIIINPPVTPDTNKVTPACPTCPITSCVVADDLTPGGQTYTSCGTPNGYTTVGPDANGCITYTPNGPNTTPDTTCIVACKNGVCDTTYIIIAPPIKPDTVIKTPACPTCSVTVCQVINDVTITTGATFSSCPTPAGYTATPTDVNGCKTYTPNGSVTSPVTTCQVICKNGVCDTTYVIINPPVTPDTNKITPLCPSCPITTCVVADDLTPGGQTYAACSTPSGYTQAGPDINGCITLTPMPGAIGGTTCIVACKNGICDTTYVIINPPVSPDTVTLKPACPTCPITACVVADDILGGATGSTFTTCPTPAGYTAVGPDANGCVTYIGPSIPSTSPVTTCIVACKNGICDTTFVIIQPPVTPDSVTATPACPTCPVTICQVLDDVPSASGATFSSCPPPAGYTLGPINALGCRTYTPNGTVTTTVTTCQVICKNGVCDTTYITINPPITPDTVKATPACPTCPVTVCQVLDDVTSTTGATFSSCPTPAGYTAGPIDANGCRTFTPNGTVTSTVTTCQVICNNGKCDTTYIIIDKPITSDTNTITPGCPTCPITTCVVADDLTPGGQTYSTCGTPNGYTAVGPDVNGCITYTPNGPNTTSDTTCIVACKNGICDTTYIIIHPPVTPDSVTVQPTCPTCPVKACVVADDLPSLTGASFASCGLSSTDATKGQLVLDLQGCLIWVGNGTQSPTDTIHSCVVACKNGVCDTTYVTILPAVPPYGPDSIYTTPTCTTCPTPPVCVTGDDIPVAATNISYTSCGLTPSASTQGSLNFNTTTGCVIWTPNPTQTDTIKTCVIVCGTVTVSTVTTTVCDTTYMFFPPPPKPDTITKTPACPTCVVVACPTADNITITTATTFSTCATPSGYTSTGPDAAGCMTYTPTSINSSSLTTCVVACNGSICDTTYVIINPPITPDTNTVQPACPTCPITTCVQADDLTPGGQTYSSCGAPSNYTQSTPDVNGCITLTPQNVTTGGTTCIVACKNGKCDTTYIVILPPVTPDTVTVTPTCATCPVTACVVADNITGGVIGSIFSTCPPPAGFTTTGPDANGCITYTGPSVPNTVPVTTCIVACKNGICDTTYVIINPPGENKLNPDFNTTFVNVPVSGNINTNDVIVAPGSTYGTPSAVAGNPSACSPTISSTGTYTFVCSTPGEYNFLVPVCPPGITVNCPTELLTITVLDPNNPQNPPTADPDYGTTKQDTPITIDVKSNDKCNNGPTCTLTPPTIVDNPNHGTVVVNPDGTIKYTPDPGFVGKDTLMYSVCDNRLPISKCDTEYVFIDVLPSNAPNSTSAMDDYNKGGMGEPVTGNVKTNDTDPEANNQTVTPQNITIPGKGTFVLNPDGSYVFTPVDTLKGPIDIPYTICDDGTPQACANATLHILIAQPDVTPNITATPNIMHSTTTFNVTVKVTELNMVKTNGTITVRIPKDNRLSFTYNPSAIKIGFTNVSNSVWNYNGTNPFFHIFTTTTVIPKGGFSTFGFVATFTPGNTDGKYTMTSTISSGSGSENRTNNNTDSESLDYFHN